MFEIQAGRSRDPERLLQGSRDVVHAVFRRPAGPHAGSDDSPSIMEAIPDSTNKANTPAVGFARCFLQLADLPNFALDRLSRYETNLWRQATRILHALETLDRRKPQERTHQLWFADDQIERE